jgi:hypothetical protein
VLRLARSITNLWTGQYMAAVVEEQMKQNDLSWFNSITQTTLFNVQTNTYANHNGMDLIDSTG